MRYRLQRKEHYVLPNILGNHSMPVYTYRWKDIAMSNDIKELKKILPKSENYRIEDTQKYEQTQAEKELQEERE